MSLEAGVPRIPDSGRRMLWDCALSWRRGPLGLVPWGGQHQDSLVSPGISPLSAVLPAQRRVHSRGWRAPSSLKGAAEHQERCSQQIFPEGSPDPLPAAFLPGRQTPTLAWSQLLLKGPQADPLPLGTQLANPLAGCRATPTLLCPRLMGAPSLAPSDGLLPTDPFGGGAPRTVHLVYLSALPGASAARLHGTLGR